MKTKSHPSRTLNVTAHRTGYVERGRRFVRTFDYGRGRALACTWEEAPEQTVGIHSHCDAPLVTGLLPRDFKLPSVTSGKPRQVIHTNSARS